MNRPSAVYQLIDEVLAAKENRMSIIELCRYGGVSRSGYYRWKRAEEARLHRDAQDFSDYLLIKEAAGQVLCPGARSIYMKLLHPPYNRIINIKKIRRLMRKYGYRCPIRRRNPRKQLSDEMKSNHYASNVLQRRFEQYGPRIALLTDITYLRISGRFLYLSVIKDACTKEILAHKLSPSLEVDFVLETVRQLAQNHGNSLCKSTLIHSDQGCHYTSYRYIELVKSYDLIRSMSRRGNCWDNAPQESFFGHMKDELDVSECETMEEAKAKIDAYIEYYNYDRYQWHLCKLSPSEYYRFVTTGKYPLDVANPPPIPIFKEATEGCWNR